ncbi:ribbon-helix-helix domain-containing protein [Leptothoe spongobia]|uniref:Uncharacterized protein n=1 Tax=Leptothoe spongobia TAU-MAC 1115 TaxID=1967444 RepID=A0A947DKV2_9CYAN|nr:hypothetical protein [Leptothoe spongobia]MBT9317744.1 hypothetical protein [Leptothoe spongobia TAU-MAC 1115]
MKNQNISLKGRNNSEDESLKVEDEPSKKTEIKEGNTLAEKRKKKNNTREVPTVPGTKRLTVVLPPETAEMLESLSAMQSITLNETIRRAISTEALIQREVRKGADILIETQDGRTKQLIFR